MPLFPRSTRTLDAAAAPTLVVRTWNVLADALSDAFPRVPPECLVWEARRPAILEQLLSAPFGRRADLLCLQEVDHFDELVAGLAPHGYAGQCLLKAAGRDGVALFHREDTLTPLPFDDPAEAHLRYTALDGAPGRQVALLARFVHRGEPLLVATTHLRAKVGHEVERASQVRELCAHLARVRRPGEALIVAGDFNDTPESAAVEALLDSPLGLASAYGATHTEAGAWTTWKIREHETRRVIDYVFHSRELEATGLLDAPDERLVPAHRLPDFEFPSDHLDLGVALARRPSIRS